MHSSSSQYRSNVQLVTEQTSKEPSEQTIELVTVGDLEPRTHRLKHRKTSIFYPSKILHAEDNRGCISFHNVTYTIKQREGCLKNRPPKGILYNVSGKMKVGLHAIMGPSGTGKTTLLDVLADRKARKGLSGHVLINGRRQPHNFKCASAYVVQDDILVGTLTVRENLLFSAALRLPASYNWKEKKEKVEDVIKELGLEKVADSRIGTQFLRGVSGGERKRTSIGMELIISPNFMFLDEPTTGLDSSTAIAVLDLLKDLSTTGRVIVLAIHQPRYAIFKLFDSLTLLSNGELVYHGPTIKALDYFSRNGYVREENDNPADFFLDVISKNEKSVHEVPEETVSLTTVFKNSIEYKEIERVLEPLLDEAAEVSRGKTPQYNRNFLWQLLVVSLRTLLNIVRDPLLALTQIIVMVALAILVGIVFLQLEDRRLGVQNREELFWECLLREKSHEQWLKKVKRIGAIFFVLVNLSFGSLFSIEFVIKEGIIFRHENVSGYYRVSAYYMAKVICDVLPLRLLPTIIFATITYWMIGFEADASKFFIYLITMILTSMASGGLAFLIGVVVNVVALANITAVFAYIFMLVFTGFLININSLGGWIAWLQYLSLFRYSLHALAVNELADNIYCNTISTSDNVNLTDVNLTDVNLTDVNNLTNITASMCDPTQTIIGNEFLDDQNYTELSVWTNELALLLFTVGLFALTYIILRIIMALRK